MPTQVQKSDYDLFDYDYENPPLPLDEAIKKAKELRSRTGGNVIYRIVPTDAKGTDFRVVGVSREEGAANFLTKFTEWVTRFTFITRIR